MINLEKRIVTNCTSVLSLIFFYSSNQDLEMALMESNATWKIVIGHHAIRSVGHHGDTLELVQKLLPLLEVTILSKQIMI